MLVKKTIDTFIMLQEGRLSDKTVQWYRFYLRPLIEHLGNRDITTLQPQDIHEYYRLIRERAEQNSAYSLFNFARAARRFFRWAREEEYIERNLAHRLPLPRVPKPDPKGISDDDLRTLLKAASASPRDYAILLFLADTGARLGGIASLTLERLDLGNRRAIVLEKGKGGNKARVVFFGETTARALEAWLHIRPKSEDDRVFLLTGDGIYQVLKRLAQRTGIKGRWNPHAFRHAFARRLLSNGASLGVVSHLMGHSTVNVTVDYYARFAYDELQAFHEKYSVLPLPEDASKNGKGDADEEAV